MPKIEPSFSRLRYGLPWSFLGPEDQNSKKKPPTKVLLMRPPPKETTTKPPKERVSPRCAEQTNSLDRCPGCSEPTRDRPRATGSGSPGRPAASRRNDEHTRADDDCGVDLVFVGTSAVGLADSLVLDGKRPRESTTTSGLEIRGCLCGGRTSQGVFSLQIT